MRDFDDFNSNNDFDDDFDDFDDDDGGIAPFDSLGYDKVGQQPQNNQFSNYQAQSQTPPQNAMGDKAETVPSNPVEAIVENNGVGNGGGFKKIMISIALVVFMIVIVLLAINAMFGSSNKSENIEPAVSEINKTYSQTNTTNNQSSQQQVSNYTASNTSTVSNNSTGSNSSAATTTTKQDYSQLTQIGTTQAENALIKVNEPSFGQTYRATAVVMSKNVYEVGGQDIYIFRLDLMISGDGASTTIPYYCNKDTYDAVKSGQSLAVTYTLDSSDKLGIIKVATN